MNKATCSYCRETRNLLEAMARHITGRVSALETAYDALAPRMVGESMGIRCGDQPTACATEDCTGTVMPGANCCLNCWGGAKGRDDDG